jgi:hypothetical protein
MPYFPPRSTRTHCAQLRSLTDLATLSPSGQVVDHSQEIADDCAWVRKDRGPVSLPSPTCGEEAGDEVACRSRGCFCREPKVCRGILNFQQ